MRRRSQKSNQIARSRKKGELKFFMIKPGEIAKATTWTFGGKVTAINESTQTVFIRVGNDQTGNIYPVPMGDCQLFDEQTGNFQPSANEAAVSV